MDNKFAVFFSITFVAAVIFDLTMNDGEYLIIWGQQLLRLLHWIAFWR